MSDSLGNTRDVQKVFEKVYACKIRDGMVHGSKAFEGEHWATLWYYVLHGASGVYSVRALDRDMFDTRVDRFLLRIERDIVVGQFV